MHKYKLMNIFNTKKNQNECINSVDLKILEILETHKTMEDISIYNQYYKDLILYLSEFKDNMINWYEIGSTSNVLIIGSNFGNILTVLSKKAHQVDIVEPSIKKADYVYRNNKELQNTNIYVGGLDEVSLERKYDYVILNNSLEFSYSYTNKLNSSNQMLLFVKSVLKQTGKMLIITNNKFGMKYFDGASDMYDMTQYSSITGNSLPTYRLYGKNELINLISDAGFDRYKFFYSLPENKAINVIFTDEFLPTNETLNKYIPIYNNFDLIHFSEVKAMKQALSNKVFDIFCNSYIIECSLGEKLSNVKFVNFNNYRKPEYRLMTVIDGSKVYKKKVGSVSQNHYNNLVKNIENLKRKYNFNVLENIENDSIVSEFKDYMAMDKYLINLLSCNDIESFIKEIDKYKKYILSNIEPSLKGENIFNKLNIDTSGFDLNKLNFIKNGYWDLTFQNMFIHNGKYYIFDQEWYEENIPIEFIIYRGLKIIFSFANITGNICHDILTKLEIADFYDLFEILENKLQNNINNSSLNKLYEYNYISPNDIDRNNKDYLSNIKGKNIKSVFSNITKIIKKKGS